MSISFHIAVAFLAVPQYAFALDNVRQPKKSRNETCQHLQNTVPIYLRIQKAGPEQERCSRINFPQSCKWIASGPRGDRASTQASSRFERLAKDIFI